MNKPAETYIGTDLHRYAWKEECIQVDAQGLHAGRDGEIICDLEVTSSRPPSPGLLSAGRFNLRAIPTRAQWQKRLETREPAIDWGAVLEYVCKKSTDHYRRGEPMVDLRELEPREGPRQLVEDSIEGDGVTAFAGDGGSGKSKLLTALGVSVATGHDIGVGTPTGCGAVIAFDWEDGDDSYGATFRAVCAGSGVDWHEVPFFYQRMTASLVESVSQMRRRIADVQAAFVIVDSLGAARNGDPESADVTIRLFNAMRSLGVPVGAVDHLPKNATDKAKPFGSVYTYNLSRSIWGVTKAQDEGQNRLTVSLTNHKSNRGRLARQRGYHIDHEVDHDGRPTSIAFMPCDVHDVPAFLPKLSQKDQLISVLKAGALADGEAVAALEASGIHISELSIRTLLSRYKETFTRVYDGRTAKIGLLSKALES